MPITVPKSQTGPGPEEPAAASDKADEQPHRVGAGMRAQVAARCRDGLRQQYDLAEAREGSTHGDVFECVQSLVEPTNGIERLTRTEKEASRRKVGKLGNTKPDATDDARVERNRLLEMRDSTAADGTTPYRLNRSANYRIIDRGVGVDEDEKRTIRSPSTGVASCGDLTVGNRYHNGAQSTRHGCRAICGRIIDHDYFVSIAKRRGSGTDRLESRSEEALFVVRWNDERNHGTGCRRPTPE